MKTKHFTEQEIENLLDALDEWWDEVGCKSELRDDEVGLDSKRFFDLVNKMRSDENE